MKVLTDESEDIVRMRRIEKLVLRKKELVDRAIKIANKLGKDFYNEDKLEKKMIMGLHQLMTIEGKALMEKKKLKADIDNPKIRKIILNHKEEGTMELRRDMDELNNEAKIIHELNMIVNELHQLTSTEHNYFSSLL